MSAYETEKQHAKGLKQAAPHKGQPTTERVGEEEDEYEARDDLYDTVDALGEEGRRGVG